MGISARAYQGEPNGETPGHARAVEHQSRREQEQEQGQQSRSRSRSSEEQWSSGAVNIRAWNIKVVEHVS